MYPEMAWCQWNSKTHLNDSTNISWCLQTIWAVLLKFYLLVLGNWLLDNQREILKSFSVSCVSCITVDYSAADILMWVHYKCPPLMVLPITRVRVMFGVGLIGYTHETLDNVVFSSFISILVWCWKVNDIVSSFPGLSRFASLITWMIFWNTSELSIYTSEKVVVINM